MDTGQRLLNTENSWNCPNIGNEKSINTAIDFWLLFL